MDQIITKDPVILMSQPGTNPFAPDSKFMNLMNKFTGVAATNILWLLLCVPVVTAGAATKAMYANMFALRRDEDCTASSFFRAFRQDFWRTTGLWALILVLAAALFADYTIVASLAFPGYMAVVCVICFVALVLVILSGMVFPMLSQFPCTIKEAVVNGVLLSLAHLPRMAVITAMNVFPVVLFLILPQVFVFTSFLWVVCGFALIAWWNATQFEKIFAPFREQKEQ